MLLRNHALDWRHLRREELSPFLVHPSPRKCSSQHWPTAVPKNSNTLVALNNKHFLCTHATVQHKFTDSGYYSCSKPYSFRVFADKRTKIPCGRDVWATPYPQNPLQLGIDFTTAIHIPLAELNTGPHLTIKGIGMYSHCAPSPAKKEMWF